MGCTWTRFCRKKWANTRRERGGRREREREKQGEAGRVGVREREINRKLRPVPAEKTDFDLNCVSV